ncbi:MAG: twin-arginine translocase subunit TatC [Pseudomonadota bacterium]
MDKNDLKLPFLEHLEELRRRLIICLIAVGVSFIICYIFAKQLFDALIHPLVSMMSPDEKLVYTSLPEAFMTYLKVSLIGGVLLATPVIFYQIWLFISPGLYKTERRLLLPAIAVSCLLFAAGALFGYFVVFPVGFKFFLGFASESIRPMLSIEKYLSLASTFLFTFGAVFEMPLFIVILVKLGIVTVAQLKQYRGYVVVGIFVVAAILTPPDAMSQIMMAIPMLVLYEASIIGAKFFGTKKSTD